MLRIRMTEDCESRGNRLANPGLPGSGAHACNQSINQSINHLYIAPCAASESEAAALQRLIIIIIIIIMIILFV